MMQHVLSRAHGFVEVHPATCLEPERSKRHLPASMFLPPAKKSSMDAKDLPGFDPLMGGTLSCTPGPYRCRGVLGLLMATGMAACRT